MLYNPKYLHMHSTQETESLTNNPRVLEVIFYI